MALSAQRVTTQPLSLPEEFILALLNEESGYFHQVEGWDLNCATVGSVLAELSLRARIDTDERSLFLLDRAQTGDPVLDAILEEIASESVQHNAQYWIERLAPHAERVIDSTLERLVKLKVLEHHDGDFWTLARNAWRTEAFDSSPEGAQFVTSRISKAIFQDEIPDPRDAIIISLMNTCDVFRFIFQLDEEAEERIRFICNMDLIGRSIAAAVAHNLTGPLLRQSALTKKIPTVPLRELLFHRHVRDRNIPALFGDLAQKYGPVFQIRPLFLKPMIFLAGPRTNRWVHRQGRMFLSAKEYFTDIEKVYGATGLLPSLDGADHFRLRKAMQPGYSRARLEGQLSAVISHGRNSMADWEAGSRLSALDMCRHMINSQISQFAISIDSKDIIDDLLKFKERALTTHVAKIMPKFLLHTPGMRRRAKAIDRVLERVQNTHTPAQRFDAPRDLADDLISLHASDPQFLPEANLKFSLSAPLLASMYMGDMFSFVVYAMASQPELYARIRSEADALFAGGDPTPGDFTPSTIDVTHRFLMECLRLYPVVPMSLRNVANSCVVENFRLPIGARIHIATTAAHYMSDVFPEPYTFDIDRYLPPRNEHLSPGYAPFGLGTHRCLGSRLAELQMAVNLLMIAHYFTLEVSPANSKLRIDPFPSMSMGKKMKFVVTEQRHELPL